MSATLAIYGGRPIAERPFPSWPVWDEREQQSLLATLESGCWWRGGAGDQVRQFERKFSEFHGSEFGIAVTNGTHGIELALRALQIGSGDEVIIPALTFAATAEAVFLTGASAVLIDVDPDTWCLDPGELEAAITERTRAVIPVHFGGQLANMEAIAAICDRHNLAVIEDAAHAHGARRRGRCAGSLADAAVFSFQNFKLMTAGEGGFVLFRDSDLCSRALLMTNCGRRFGDRRYEHNVLGSNFRLSEFQAAVLSVQLERLDAFGEQRERQAARLRKWFDGVDGVTVQTRDPLNDRHAYYMFAFEYDASLFGGYSRDDFVEALVAEGVPAYRVYPRIQDTGFYETALRKSGTVRTPSFACLCSQRIAEQGVCLHQFVLLADDAVLRQVVDAIEKIRDNVRRAPRGVVELVR